MNSLTPFFESKIQEVLKEKQALEKMSAEINNRKEGVDDKAKIIKQGEIESKLFWLRSLERKLRSDMEEYRAVVDTINLCKV